MIVATAGHVDHGKTLLVKMLTGMDTDRLEEEKRRGLSINLGFAYRHSPETRTIVFVDVPGHIRFINNMIAGINGIDFGMLVVAADDGPMPQTREHMDVLKLLGVTRFVLVISKIDRVEKARVDEVRAEALTLFPSADEVPVFTVNSPEQLGIPELAVHLESEAAKLKEKPVNGYFRLSIDRVFLIKGSGLVVTGTVAAGRVKVGDTLTLMPQKVSVRVRTLQVQEQDQEQAICGQRCALNISGNVEKSDIERGDWLLVSDIAESTTRFDSRITLVPNLPFAIKHMSPVKLYIGAKRSAAKLALLEQKNLMLGESTFAQLIIDRPVHCCHGDRFLLRDDSENETLGGGIVLDPFASARQRSTTTRLAVLNSMQDRSAGKVLSALLFEHKQIVNLSEFFLSWNIREDETSALLDLVNKLEKTIVFERNDAQLAVAENQWSCLQSWILKTLQAGAAEMHNNKNQGYERRTFLNSFKQQFPGIDPVIVLARMESTDGIINGQETISLKKPQQTLSVDQEKVWNAIEAYLQKSAYQVPALSDMEKALSLDQKTLITVCQSACKFKWLTLIAKNRYVLSAHLVHFAGLVQTLTSNQGPFSVAEFKNTCGIGRNLAVEVLEYFDKIGYTLRKDKGRVILDENRVTALLNKIE